MEKPLDTPFLAWLVGLVGTATLGWIGWTSRSVQKHEVKIAELNKDVLYIREGIDDIKAHLGIRPKE